MFSANDIKLSLPPYAVIRALTNLEKDGKIERILPGMYYYPEYNEILKQNASPDMWKVAKALARKFCWHIYPDGNTILNYFGLSTQVVAKNSYVSDGPSKTYKIGKTAITFQHVPNKEIIKHSEKATIVIQAVKAMGKVHAAGWFITSLSDAYSAKEWKKIAKKSAGTTGWIYDVIKQARDAAINKECDLSDEAKQGIEDGLKSMEENKGIPLEQIRKK